MSSSTHYFEDDLPSQSLDYCKTHKANQELHKNLNNHARKLLTYSQTKPTKTAARFRGRFVPYSKEKSRQQLPEQTYT